MRLVTFATSAGSHLGVVDGDEIADVTAADNRLGPDLGAVLAAGLLDEVAGAVAGAPRIALERRHAGSPVLRPPKFLAIGLNYAKHVAESGMDAPPSSCGSTSSRRAPSVMARRSTCPRRRPSSTTRASSPS